MQNNVLSRIIFVVLCGILLWAPIPLGSNRAWAWSFLQVLIGSAFFLHLVHCWQTNTALFAARKFWLALAPLVILLGWLLLQSWQILPSADRYQTSIMATKTLFFLLWCSLLLNHCTGHKRIRLLALVIVISGALQAFYGVVVQLANIEASPVIGMSEGSRARGSFVYQNHFANYLALSLSVAIGLLLSQLSSERTQRNWRQLFRDLLSTMLSAKMMLRLAMILMVIGLVMSRSRMGNAAFFTSLILVAVLALWFYKRPPALLKPLVVSILLLDMVLVSSMFGLDKLQERYQDTSFVSEARDNVVRDALPLLSAHAWTGSGGGTFYTVFPQVQPSAYSGFYDHAHNDYLQFAIELGIPMTSLLLIWLLWLSYLAMQVMRTHDHKLERGLSFAALMAILHMGLHSTVDFSLQAPANALLFLTILMLVLICHAQPAKLSRRRSASVSAE